MRKVFLVFACIIGSVNLSQADTVSISIDAGALRNTTGTAVVPTGGLLQLLASPSGTFSAPTSASYATGDNIVVTSFAMNMLGGTGETNSALGSFTLSTTLTAGEALQLRFFPSLTYVGMPAAPTLGTTFGQVRSGSIEFGPSGGVPNETAWVVPSGGASVTLEYVTVSNGGTAAYSNVSAYATGIVVAGVPEPSSIAQCSLAVGMLGWAMFRRCRA